MFHYLFTNDLRISTLDAVLQEAARCFRDDCVPSASEDKNANNNMMTLGFYFNLTKNSNCTQACAKGNTRKVVLNFIKKFQFPNPRTTTSLNDCINDGITLAPMRVILQTLYVMRMITPNEAYLTRKEILNFIFFNSDVAKNKNPDIPKLAKTIVDNRDSEADNVIPDDNVLEDRGYYWKHCSRQIREMTKILCWAGCASERDDGAIIIKHDSLSRDNEADLFEIITYSDFWVPDSSKKAENNKESYQKYMDIIIDDNVGENMDINKANNVGFNTGYQSSFARNRIIFGAPGTGKSFRLNQEMKVLLGSEASANYERVTFHPDYSYANFVGTYKPVMVSNQNKNSSDSETQEVISVLADNNISAQEKYDLLFDKFKGDGLTRLPILLGLYSDDLFKTRKQDGSEAAYDNSVERNHGRAIRKYVQLVGEMTQKSEIAYEYVPGPFMRVYVKALKNARSKNPEPFLLIIEEINRANVAAVFGDVFQLLDRDDNNVSEYPIQASEDMKKYLAKELGGDPDDYSTIRIPDNMFIWATMNSADQGVFPMDTAFKRRWDFTYIGIDDSDKDIRGKYVVVGNTKKQRIEWNELRKSINDFLASEKINEDKQLGPYFIGRNIVVPENGNEIDSKKFCDAFKHKVLMYLFDDAAKQKRGKLFEGSAKGQVRYSKICEAFDEQGIDIFHPEIRNRVKIQDREINDH